MVYFFLFTVVALSWSTYSPSWHVSVALTVLLGLVGYLMFHRRTTLEAHFQLRDGAAQRVGVARASEADEDVQHVAQLFAATGEG